MSAADYTFWKPVNASARNKELPYWAAATVHNSVKEFKTYSTEFNLGQAPTGLKILISNVCGNVKGTGATPMFNKCHTNLLPVVWTTFFIAVPSFVPAGLTALGTVLKNNVDVSISYLPGDGDYNCTLTSARIKATSFHELGHTQHYNKVGSDFWVQYRNSIINELTKLNLTEYQPYGNGTDATNAPIIALGEMWGNHCEYTYTNRHYANGGSQTSGFEAPMQRTNYPNTSALNCYLNALENFNPTSLQDIHKWIPQGLPYDLMDNGTELPLILDNVVGYSYIQSFNALEADVRSVQGFKARLLQQNSNNQLISVNELFTSYNY